MRVRQVADVLNYADAAAFTRAFHRWSGTTPARWRASARVGTSSPVTAPPVRPVE